MLAAFLGWGPLKKSTPYIHLISREYFLAISYIPFYLGHLKGITIFPMSSAPFHHRSHRQWSSTFQEPQKMFGGNCVSCSKMIFPIMFWRVFRSISLDYCPAVSIPDYCGSKLCANRNLGIYMILKKHMYIYIYIYYILLGKSIFKKSVLIAERIINQTFYDFRNKKQTPALWLQTMKAKVPASVYTRCSNSRHPGCSISLSLGGVDHPRWDLANLVNGNGSSWGQFRGTYPFGLMEMNHLRSLKHQFSADTIYVYISFQGATKNMLGAI